MELTDLLSTCIPQFGRSPHSRASLSILLSLDISVDMQKNSGAYKEEDARSLKLPAGECMRVKSTMAIIVAIVVTRLERENRNIVNLGNILS